MKAIRRIDLIFLAAAVAGTLLTSFSANAADSGVSIDIGPGGAYGRVNIGQQPPTVVYPQPVIIQQTPVAVVQRPIYLRVPAAHYQNWSQYCGRYRACSQPVYFVQGTPVAHHSDHVDHDGDHADDDDHKHKKQKHKKHGNKHGHGHGH